MMLTITAAFDKVKQSLQQWIKYRQLLLTSNLTLQYVDLYLIKQSNSIMKMIATALDKIKHTLHRMLSYAPNTHLTIVWTCTKNTRKKIIK